MDLLQIIQITLLVSIGIIAFIVLKNIFENKRSKKFLMKGSIEVKEEVFSTEQITLLERLLSFEKYKLYLQNQLKDARMNITAVQFIKRRLFLAVSVLVLMLVLFSITHVNLYLYLALPLTVLAYKVPKRSIAKNKNNYIYFMKLELPEYLGAFAEMLNSYIPYEATKKSVDYAGPLLKPYVEDLITQIALYPNSHKPYYDFAEAVGLREAKEFVIALEQIMKVDANDAKSIIKEQIKVLEALQEEAYNEQVKKREEQIQATINPLLFPFVGIIMTILFVLMTNTRSFI